jgi:4-hydroxy-tetrahydrodipicolinate reductase
MKDNSKNIKMALLGAGKTGKEVIPLLGSGVTVFNTSTPPTVENLQGHDVIISFLPGHAFKQHLNTLLESKIPVVSGTTGYQIPFEVDSVLKKNGVIWVWAHNFSLGMTLVKEMIEVLKKAPQLFETYEYSLNEIHHTKKLDKPSGTALSWAEWLSNTNITITSERVGDEIGTHQLTLKTPLEKISITHNALSRKIFAQGAVWTAKKILSEPVSPGLYSLSDFIMKEAL